MIDQEHPWKSRSAASSKWRFDVAGWVGGSM